MGFKSDKQRKGFFAMKGLKGTNVNTFNNTTNKSRSTSSKVSVTSSSNRNKVIIIDNVKYTIIPTSKFSTGGGFSAGRKGIEVFKEGDTSQSSRRFSTIKEFRDDLKANKRLSKKFSGPIQTIEIRKALRKKDLKTTIGRDKDGFLTENGKRMFPKGNKRTYIIKASVNGEKLGTLEFKAHNKENAIKQALKSIRKTSQGKNTKRKDIKFDIEDKNNLSETAQFAKDIKKHAPEEFKKLKDKDGDKTPDLFDSKPNDKKKQSFFSDFTRNRLLKQEAKLDEMATKQAKKLEEEEQDNNVRLRIQKVKANIQENIVKQKEHTIEKINVQRKRLKDIEERRNEIKKNTRFGKFKTELAREGRAIGSGIAKGTKATSQFLQKDSTKRGFRNVGKSFSKIIGGNTPTHRRHKPKKNHAKTKHVKRKSSKHKRRNVTKNELAI